MNKHYIRVFNGYILGFSDAFEVPKDGDILINEEAGRHFEINGDVNPPLHGDKGEPLFKLLEDNVVETSNEEREEWIAINVTPDPDPNLTVEERVENLESIVLGV
jgi:hypothetical protein